MHTSEFTSAATVVTSRVKRFCGLDLPRMARRGIHPTRADVCIQRFSKVSSSSKSVVTRLQSKGKFPVAVISSIDSVETK